MRTLSMKLRRIIPKSRRTRNQDEDNFSSAAEEVDQTEGALGLGHKEFLCVVVEVNFRGKSRWEKNRW